MKLSNEINLAESPSIYFNNHGTSEVLDEATIPAAEVIVLTPYSVRTHLG